MSAFVDLLREAFPRDAEGRTVCAFCGKPRGRDKATCRSCWFSIKPVQRAAYMDMDLETRARWILDNRPVMAPAQ